MPFRIRMIDGSVVDKPEPPAPSEWRQAYAVVACWWVPPTPPLRWRVTLESGRVDVVDEPPGGHRFLVGQDWERIVACERVREED